MSGTVPRADKLYILGLSALGCVGSVVCLTKVPLHILDFDVSDAAEELSAAVAEVLSAAVPGAV